MFVERSVAEREATFDDRRPGLLAAPTVDAEAPRLLEGSDRGFGRVGERPGIVGRGGVTEGAESPLEVPDGFAPGSRERTSAPSIKR